MIGYLTIGCNDLERGAQFYDALLAPLSPRRMEPNDRIILWSVKGSAMLGIAKPFDGEPASVGNGAMVALRLESQDAVNAMHAKALELGGADEGAPGLRGESFYGGYFRDLEGNKLVAFCSG
ncbi:MAG: VOC family protein [Gammaproteobacteria bacterium]|nr:VOC family protein [Gammaproteobacteria bacterium]